MKKFSLFCGTIVLCAAALIVFAGVDSLAGEQEGPTQITRVGGANAFFRAPDGLTAEAFKAMCVEKKEEITALLYEAGWQWGPEVFFDAVAAGQFKEVQFPVGGELEWMMFRQKGKPTLGYNFIRAGKEPLDAFEVTMNVDDTKNQKDYVYKFIVAIAITPVIYGAHHLMDWYLGKETADELIHAAESGSEDYATGISATTGTDVNQP
jgi:hypothetical protein